MFAAKRRKRTGRIGEIKCEIACRKKLMRRMPFSVCRKIAVFHITEHREAKRCKMRADLMRPPGVKCDAEERNAVMRAEHFIARADRMKSVPRNL